MKYNDVRAYYMQANLSNNISYYHYRMYHSDNFAMSFFKQNHIYLVFHEMG